MLFLAGLGFVSCVDKSKGSGFVHDTIVKGSVDTIGQQVIQGTPGNTGTDANRKDSSSKSGDSLRKGTDSSKK